MVDFLSPLATLRSTSTKSVIRSDGSREIGTAEIRPKQDYLV